MESASETDSIRRRIAQVAFPQGYERQSLPRFVKRRKKRAQGQSCSADLIVSKNASFAVGSRSQERGCAVLRDALSACKSELGISGLEELESGSLAITLDRSHLIRNCVARLVTSGQDFGHRHVRPANSGATSPSTTHQPLVVDVAALWLVPAHAAFLSVDSLRVVLAAQHLASVVRTQGINPIMVAEAVSCGSDLMQAAIVLGCLEKLSSNIASQWVYSRESVEQLCDVAAHLAGDSKKALEVLNADSRTMVRSLEQCLAPSSGVFPEGTVRSIRTLLEGCVDSYSVAVSVVLVRQLQSIPSLWSALLRLRRCALSSCLSLFSNLSIAVSVVDIFPLLLSPSAGAGSVPYCRVAADRCAVISQCCAPTDGLRSHQSINAPMAETVETVLPERQGVDALYAGGTVVVDQHAESCSCAESSWDESRIQPPLVRDMDSGECSLDAKACILHHKLPSGKSGFAQSSAMVTWRGKSGLLSPVAAHSIHCARLMARFQCPIVHVVANSLQILLQRSNLLMHAIWPAHLASTGLELHALLHLVSSNVEDSSKMRLTCHQYFQAYREQMIEAAVCKLGRIASNSYVQRTALGMTISCVKFQMLTSPLNHVVKTKLLAPAPTLASADGGVQDSRDGVFAMYNYARLSTLFDNFEKAVQAGTYPPLPHIDQINFALLTDESEWHLVLNGMASYPDCLLEVSPRDNFNEAMQPTDGIHLQCTLNKVCLYLVAFCRDLSSYYSRVHVLEEPSPHRFPVMFARLYLLLACKQILANALDLLGIDKFDLM